VTNTGRVIGGSEVGVLEIPEETVIQKGRLLPGKMFLIDFAQGKMVSDEEYKAELIAKRAAHAHPPARSRARARSLSLSSLSRPRCRVCRRWVSISMHGGIDTRCVAFLGLVGCRIQSTEEGRVCATEEGRVCARLED
jgi:hypothetical protein